MAMEWRKFNKDVIENTHGSIFFYRDLYEGNHGKLFERARSLIENGEVTDQLIYGNHKAKNVKTPYMIANVSKLIAEIPATLVSRSIGKVKSSIQDDMYVGHSNETREMIDEPSDDQTPEIDEQQELIEQISKNSNLQFEHWGNIVQHQVDGGLVGVPWLDERGLRIDFKARDVYYPHDDDMGADLAYEIEIDGDDYLHIYRERVEENNLVTSHLLYPLNETKDTGQALGDDDTMKLLGIDEVQKVYEGRTRPFIIYWANEKSIMNPLGKSCLKNQEGKQDDINWTLTRNAITFERNGKPRIAVTEEIMQALQQKAMERYGDESAIDHRDLEITTFDDSGKALEVIQIDIDKIGDIKWVKDLIKLMLMETQTSEKAVDFYLDNSSGQAQSGVSKFYDLFTSMLKAERIQSEYIYFLSELFESALWLGNYNDSNIIIEEPDIALKSILPVSRKERTEDNTTAYEKGAQSLETTVRNNNPNASEEWIQEELERIESEKSDDDSLTFINGRQSVAGWLGNRDEDGNPLPNEEEENG